MKKPELYTYCTDFIINLANITGLSYYELNFVIFIVLYPLLLFVAPRVYIIQKSGLRHHPMLDDRFPIPVSKNGHDKIEGL